METDAHMMSQQYAQAQPTQIQHAQAPQPSTLKNMSICNFIGVNNLSVLSERKENNNYRRRARTVVM